jgi:hypothetical protein
MPGDAGETTLRDDAKHDPGRREANASDAW